MFIALFKALPFGEGAPRRGGRERCSKKLRYYQCFGENVLPVHLFRHGIRRATFPRGEDKGAAAPVR